MLLTPCFFGCSIFYFILFYLGSWSNKTIVSLSVQHSRILLLVFFPSCFSNFLQIIVDDFDLKKLYLFSLPFLTWSCYYAITKYLVLHVFIKYMTGLLCHFVVESGQEVILWYLLSLKEKNHSTSRHANSTIHYCTPSLQFRKKIIWWNKLYVLYHIDNL